ncbi:MAG: heme-binding protein [bacterium]
MRLVVISTSIGIMVCLACGGCATSVKEAEYKVVRKSGNFEVRDYAAHIVAETVVDATLTDAGNVAFRPLFGYISGANKSREKIAMTAPVSQRPVSEKIAMTAPVGQQRVQGGWAISFMMPSSYTMESLPVPDDPAISLRQIAARRMAAVKYSGGWSESRYRRYKNELEIWMGTNRYLALGEPVWARYDPPFMPWFLRRNEILIPFQSDGLKGKQDQGAGSQLREQHSPTP